MVVFADAEESGEEEETPKKAKSAAKSARKPAKQAVFRSAQHRTKLERSSQ